MQLTDDLSRRIGSGSIVTVGQCLPGCENHGRSGTLNAATGLVDRDTIVFCPEFGSSDLARAVTDLRGVLSIARVAVLGVCDPEAPLRLDGLRDMLSENGLQVCWGGLVEDDKATMSRNTWGGVITRAGTKEAKELTKLLASGNRNLLLDDGDVGSLPLEPLQPPARIAIVTEEIFGPSRCGGLGTAFTSLAEALAEAGQDITILFIGETETPEPVDHWIGHYRDMGIKFCPVDVRHPDGMSWEFAHLRRSHLALEALVELEAKDGAFETIHFPEVNGFGYFPILAKRNGVAFADATICVQTFGSSRWQRTGNGFRMDRVFNIVQDLTEPFTVAAADVVVSASSYLFSWMAANGYTLPRRHFVLQYVQPQAARDAAEQTIAEAREPVKGLREIVFFGRLEPRKGLLTTLDAIDLLLRQDARCLEGVQVTFLGKPSQVDGTDLDAESYIASRAVSWNDQVRWKILPDKTQVEAVDYLRGQGRLTLIPSIIDNSPNTVMEALGLGVPFITARTGGIGELIHPDDISGSTFFHPIVSERHRPLADRLRSALVNGLAPARRSVVPSLVESQWVAWHRGNALEARRQEAPLPDPDRPTVTCCLPIAPNVDAGQIAAVLDSIAGQDYPHIETIVAVPEGAGPSHKAIDRMIETGSDNPAAAWNATASESQGKYVVFLDGTERLESGAIGAFVRAAQTSSASFFSAFCPDQGQPLGELGSYPMVDPGIVPTLADLPVGPLFAKRSAFLRTDGFDPSGGTLRPGWEFLVWLTQQPENEAGHTVVPVVVARHLTATVELTEPQRFDRSERLMKAYRSALPKAHMFLPGYLDAISNNLSVALSENGELAWRVGEGFEMMEREKNAALADVDRVRFEADERVRIESEQKAIELEKEKTKVRAKIEEERLTTRETERRLQKELDDRMDDVRELMAAEVWLKKEISERDQRIVAMEKEIERIWQELTSMNERRKGEIANLKDRVKNSESELKEMRANFKELGRDVEKTFTHRVRKTFGKKS